MKKIFSFLTAVLFAGSMMATEVIFTNADFNGQGISGGGVAVHATKSGVTFTCSSGYSAAESLRCYANSALSITAEATIEKINFKTTDAKSGGLAAEVIVNASSYSVDLASQARFTEIKVTLASEGGEGGEGGGEEPTNCAEAAAAALSVSANNELYNNGAVYTITGYVTSIKTAYSDQFHNISFWMADAVDGGEVLQAYRAACASEADAPVVGDKVAVTGTLTKYNTTPEFSAACTFEILEHAAPAANYFLVGTNNGWSGADYQLAANPAAAGEYMLDVTFAAADEFKVIGVVGEDTTWYPDGENNNYVINEAGDYAVYFRPDGQGGEGWHYGVIYAAKKEAPADPTNCAEAAAAALSVENNNDLYNNGAVYTITGYVTSIKTAYSDQFHNISFWMADAADGGEVLQAYRAACASEADAPVVGDKVAVTGTLTKYNTTPEFSAACTFEILEHAAPAANYFLVGTLNNWNGEGYQFAANPAAAGEYMLDVEFAAGDEFKVIGVLEGDTTWYPAQAGNCTINDEGLYTVYFRPDYQGGQDWYEGCIYNVKKEAPIVHQYEVAEAIAAGLAEDTEIMVRGVVTKIEFKGKNFAKYGSANIYVADATGAEGAFEFFNCYSFDADTFRTSSPEYDATSTAWAEFDMVADENGNEVHVGDTIIAFGKYKLYNATHELNTGCYIVSVIPGEGTEPGEEVIIDVEYADAMYIAEQAYWQFNLYKDYNAETEVTTYPDLYIGVAPKSETAIAGTYSLDNEEIYFIEIDLDENTTITSVEATDLVVTCLGEGVYHYELAFLGDDNNSYILDVELLTEAFDAEYNPIELTDEATPVEGVANVVVENKAVKVIVRGQLIIKKNGAEYNAAGQLMK